ncbi:MAG: T9SS type A sorting domain-containing protein, partial [Saprospiraceae bacterium]
IDQWQPQPTTEMTGTITLERGKRYPIRLEYFESVGGAVIRLEWSGENIASHLVPQGQLFAADAIDIQQLTEVALPYPNPVTDVLQLKLYTLEEVIAQLEIYAVNGQLMYSEKIAAQPVQVDREIDTRDWGKGIYLVRWQFGEEEKILKIVKQ